MKKKIITLGMLCVTALSIAACAKQTGNQETTISSLKAENASLKARLKAYEETANSNAEAKKQANISGSNTYNQTHGLNEEVFVKNDNGNTLYSFKIIKATTALTQTDEFYTKGKPQNTVEVTYEYKNYGVDKPMMVNVQFVHAFDENGQAGEDMHMQDGQTEVTADHSAQSKVWFVMPNDQTSESEITIEYSNDFTLGFDNKTIKFKVPLEHWYEKQ